MTTMQRVRRYFLTEPFIWIFYTFFQPRRFDRELKLRYPRRLQRLELLFRLIVPMILVSLPIAIAGRATLLPLHLVPSNITDFFTNITLGIAVGVAFAIAFGMAFAIAFTNADGIAFGIVGGITFTIARGIVGGIGGGLTGGIAIAIVSIAAGITFAITVGPTIGNTWAITGTIAIIVGIFRLPFYLVSGPSAYRAYRAGQRHPSRVFDHLHRCSLYWDELVYLPLPFLKQTLLLAYDESPQKALDELAFIATERPLQLRAARAAVLEIAICDLEGRKSLEEIAAAAQRLAELLPPDTKLVDPRWSSPFARLSDSSRDAMRTLSPIGLQGRRDALNDMQANLRKVHPDVAFRDQRLNGQLAQVVANWHEIARQKQEDLSRAAQDMGNIDNPYKPGQNLSLKDSLFVGRHDLAKELEASLSKGSRRPTFLLNGERRMGKTSVLRQLPNLLGSRYIPVFFNLQDAGIYSSTMAFLGTLAESIGHEMQARAMPVDQMKFGLLQEAQLANSPTTYRYFDDWLTRVEEVLEREDRTLLLTFDEFEILEEAEQARYMDVRLLLNWMRSIIQFHPRIAFLFSGVKTFDDMGSGVKTFDEIAIPTHIDWTNYFINVQMLRVSFLKSDEARYLITHPTPDFPGEEIFALEVVESIIAETGCHPFLVQAVCSALITLLNIERRDQATLEDVPVAVEKALEAWKGHFANLWNRSDYEQCTCLRALLVEQSADQQTLTLHTDLDEKSLRRTLQKLTRRDLVLRNQDDTYSIAIPMFRKWLEQNV